MRVYKGIAETSELFCERGGTAVKVSSDFYKKIGTSDFPLVPTWQGYKDSNL